MEHIKVLQVMRRPLDGYQSFERLFAAMNSCLPSDIVLRTKYLPCHTVGFFRRCANVFAALSYRAQVIHITGDVCIQTEFKSVPRPWPKRPVILMVGTKPNKNLPRMLAALKGLQPLSPSPTATKVAATFGLN